MCEARRSEPGKIVWKLPSRWQCYKIFLEGAWRYVITNDGAPAPDGGNVEQLFRLPKGFHLRRVEGAEYYEPFHPPRRFRKRR